MQLMKDGWRVLEVWECTLKGREKRPFQDILSDCADFIEGSDSFATIGRDQTVMTDDSV